MTALARQLECSRNRNCDWSAGLDSVVAELRMLRERSQAIHPRLRQAVSLPSREKLVQVIEGLRMVLFPQRLSGRELAGESTDAFVRQALEQSLSELADQLLREMRHTAGRTQVPQVLEAQAADVVRQFAGELPRIRALLESDLQAAFQGDPAARSVDEVLVCYPGMTAIIYHRLAHTLYQLGLPLVARMVAEIAHSLTGIDIHPGAQVGGSFFIDHGTGVVIGETSVIGEHVRLYQAVTLGARSFPTDADGVLIKGNARHPIVEDGVVIYAGATILGRITIGKGSVIGGNVWLTRSVPPGSQVSQAKLRGEDFNGGSGI